MAIFKEEVEYIGYVLSEKGRKISNEQIKAIQDMLRPITKKQVRAFLGAVGFYRP